MPPRRRGPSSDRDGWRPSRPPRSPGPSPPRAAGPGSAWAASSADSAADVQPRLAERVGVGRVGAPAALVVGLGTADIDQAVQQSPVALGRLGGGLGLRARRPARPPGPPPAGAAPARHRAPAVARLRRRRRPPAPRGPGRPTPPLGQAAQPGRTPGVPALTRPDALRGLRSSRWSSTQRQPAPPSSRPGAPVARQGARSAAAPARSADALASASSARAALGGPGQLGLAQPLLHAGQVGGHATGDHARIGRSVPGLGGQAVAGQGQELARRHRSAPAGPAPRPCRPAPPLEGSRSTGRRRTPAAPVRISQRIEPSANTSARRSMASVSPRACSGAM